MCQEAIWSVKPKTSTSKLIGTYIHCKHHHCGIEPCYCAIFFNCLLPCHKYLKTRSIRCRLDLVKNASNTPTLILDMPQLWATTYNEALYSNILYNHELVVPCSISAVHHDLQLFYIIIAVVLTQTLESPTLSMSGLPQLLDTENQCQ